jgi:hypothetical protein
MVASHSPTMQVPLTLSGIRRQPSRLIGRPTRGDTGWGDGSARFRRRVETPSKCAAVGSRCRTLALSMPSEWIRPRRRIIAGSEGAKATPHTAVWRVQSELTRYGGSLHCSAARVRLMCGGSPGGDTGRSVSCTSPVIGPSGGRAPASCWRGLEASVADTEPRSGSLRLVAEDSSEHADEVLGARGSLPSGGHAYPRRDPGPRRLWQSAVLEGVKRYIRTIQFSRGELVCSACPAFHALRHTA